MFNIVNLVHNKYELYELQGFFMNNFTDIVNRLKTELSLTMDKDIAEFLGMTKTAFAERKRRGVFPKEALKLADMQHPEYRLDLDYILTGERDSLRNFLNNQTKWAIDHPTDPEDYSIQEVVITPKDADTYVLLNEEERMLLSFFRRSGTKGRNIIFDTAKMACDLSIASMRLDEYTEKNI